MRHILAIVILFSATTTLSQELKVKYQPNEIQSLRLKVAQQQAQIAQKDLFIAQQNFQLSVSALKTEADKVKKENGWDAGVLFDTERLLFIDISRSLVVPSPTEEGK